MPDALHDIATLSGHEARITGACFAPGRSDRLLSCGKDGALVVWTLTGEDHADAQLFRHDAPITAAHFWPDDEAAIFCADDGTARLIDLGEGTETARFTTIEAMRADAAPSSPLARRIAATADAAGTIVAALIPFGALLTAHQSAEQKKQRLSSAAADAAKSRLAAVSIKPELILFDLASLEPLRSWKLPAEAAGPPVFLANGSVAVCVGPKVLIFDEHTTRPIAAFKPSNTPLRHVLPLGPSAMIGVDESKHVVRIDLERTLSQVIARLPAQPEAVGLIGGRLLIGDTKRGVTELDLAAIAPEPVFAEPLILPGGKIRHIAGSDDGARFLAVTNDNRLRVYERRIIDPTSPASAAGPGGAPAPA
ncbi:MAG: WD40 repeat domain-containing protein [Planctomycetota bacterium]